MSTAREKFYRCTFTARSRRLTQQVRAWGEAEAAAAFAEWLAEEGVTARGRIEVVHLAGAHAERHLSGPAETA